MEDQKPKMGKSRVLLAVGIIILLIIGVIIFAKLNSGNRSQESNKTSVIPITSPVYLYFTPPSIKLQLAKQNGISSNIVLDTQGKGVSIVQMELSFDPEVISNVKITKTEDTTSLFSEFKVGQSVVNQAAGKAFITFSVNNTNTDSPKSGKGSLATVKYNVINKSNSKKTVIEITPLTALITKGQTLRFEKIDLEISFP